MMKNGYEYETNLLKQFNDKKIATFVIARLEKQMKKQTINNGTYN